MEKYREDAKSAGYFKSFPEEVCEDSTKRALLKCLKQKWLGRGMKLLEEIQPSAGKVFVWSDNISFSLGKQYSTQQETFQTVLPTETNWYHV